MVAMRPDQCQKGWIGKLLLLAWHTDCVQHQKQADPVIMKAMAVKLAPDRICRGRGLLPWL